MSQKSLATTHWTTFGSYGFLAITLLALVKDQWLVAAIPFAIALVFYAFFKPRYVFFAIVFLTPLSLNLEDLGRGTLSFYLPTEPMLFGFMILLILGQITKRIIPKEVICHPVSLAIYVYICWMFVTTLTSVQPIVSIKFLIARLWFIIPIYFAGATIFLNHRHIPKFLVLYLIPFVLVVLYTTIKHNGYGFDEEAAHWVMEPFYRDHTQYGAVVALFIPIVFGFAIQSKQHPEIRLLSLGVLTLLLITLLYTYSRAALLSVVLAFGIWTIVKLKIRFSYLLGLGTILSIVLLLTFDDILIKLQKNHTDSSENLVENVESIANISTDASNLERINRWNSVFAMAREKPFLGFGPGTYMFQYAPYQQSKDLTIISTNFGDVGNAHSEYLGPLAETGIPGLFTVLALVFYIFWTAYHAYGRLEDGKTRQYLLFSTLALVTYFCHGLLNNFLDSDKASVPVFGMMAIIVAIDIASRKRDQISK